MQVILLLLLPLVSLAADEPGTGLGDSCGTKAGAWTVTKCDADLRLALAEGQLPLIRFLSVSCPQYSDLLPPCAAASGG